MQTITLETQIETKVDHKIDIPVPCYFASKDGEHYLAVLDENNVIKLTMMKGYRSMQCSSIKTFKSEIIQAWQTYHGCIEDQFMEKYDEVMESMHPILKP